MKTGRIFGLLSLTWVVYAGLRTLTSFLLSLTGLSSVVQWPSWQEWVWCTLLVGLWLTSRRFLRTHLFLGGVFCCLLAAVLFGVWLDLDRGWLRELATPISVLLLFGAGYAGVWLPCMACRHQRMIGDGDAAVAEPDAAVADGALPLAEGGPDGQSENHPSSLRRRLYLAAVIFVALFLIGSAVLVLMARRHATCMLHYAEGGVRTPNPSELAGWQKVKVLLTGVHAPKPLSDVTPEQYGLPFETWEADCGEGQRLSMWYVPATGSVALVMFHGYAAERSSLLPRAVALHRADVPVVLVDFRGHGASSGSDTTLGVREAEDVRVALATCRQRLQGKAVAAYGHSMGAAALLRAVSELDMHPAGVVAESVFDRLLVTIRNRFRVMRVPSFPAAELLVFWGGQQFGFNGFRHNPVRYAASVREPTLVLHGRHDPWARIEEGRAVYRAIPADQKKFVEFPDAGHADVFEVAPEHWTQEVVDFLKSLE